MPESEARCVQYLGRELRPDKLFVIAGPCVIESDEMLHEIAGTMKEIGRALEIEILFKASYQKANRTSINSYVGPGQAEGLAALARVREATGLPILSDVHTPEEVPAAGQVLDVLQIPAFLCRQTDLLQAAVETGRVVNVKKGQFLSPQEMTQVVKKAESFGGKKLLLTERGTTFGYNNLVSDMRAIPIMKRNGYPVIFDATHSVQMPGGAGDRSGGQGEFAPLLARCAVTAGADGIFVETHPNPAKALSDGPNMVPLKAMKALITSLVRLREALR